MTFCGFFVVESSLSTRIRHRHQVRTLLQVTPGKYSDVAILRSEFSPHWSSPFNKIKLRNENSVFLKRQRRSRDSTFHVKKKEPVSCKILHSNVVNDIDTQYPTYKNSIFHFRISRAKCDDVVQQNSSLLVAKHTHTNYSNIADESRKNNT